MANDPIPIELHKFLARYIRSVEQLEILCLLAENPKKTWSEGEVFKSIQSSQESVTKGLCYFADEQLLIFDAASGYRFSPKSQELMHLTLDLVKTYRKRRVTVVEAIYLMPPDPIWQFADAFKIRKDIP